MGIKFSNNATATLAASISSSSTSLTVTTGQGALFPALATGDYFYATLTDSSNNLEIVKVTARSGDTLTATRGQESTTARAYAAADKLELRVTAAGLNNFVDADGENTFAGVNTFTGNITSSGTNTFSGTNNFTGTVSFTTVPSFSGGGLPVANGGTGVTTKTGTGSVVLSTSPTLTTPTLTTPTINFPTLNYFTFDTYGNIKALFETATITASAPTSTTNFNISTQAVQYYTSNATTNFTLNFRGAATATISAGSFVVGTVYTILTVGTTDFTAIGASSNTVGVIFTATGAGSGSGNATTGSLNSILSTGQSVTCTLLVTNGTTAYRPTAFQIDGSAVTPKWQGGYTPVTGNASSIDVYTFAIVKTASATYTVLAAQTQYA